MSPARVTPRPVVLGVQVRSGAWFRPLRDVVVLEPGTPGPDLLKVPAGDAQRILRQTVRLVADIPKGSSPDVVWVNGDSELLVRTADIGLACLPGLVTISVPVGCDQLPAIATVEVPFAVGTEKSPTGLVMSTLGRPTGPVLVVDGWSGPLVAFAWEALVHLAQSLCGAVGSDAAGRPLIPAYIGADRNLLLLQPMARHGSVRRR